MRPVARVDHGHHDAGAGGLVPGGRRIDASGGLEVMPLLVVTRVIGREHLAHDAIGFGVFDVRIAGGDIGGEALGLGQRQLPIDPEHLRAECRGAHAVQAHAETLPPAASVPRICAAVAPAVAGLGAVLDDDAIGEPGVGRGGRQRHEHHESYEPWRDPWHGGARLLW